MKKYISVLLVLAALLALPTAVYAQGSEDATAMAGDFLADTEFSVYYDKIFVELTVEGAMDRDSVISDISAMDGVEQVNTGAGVSFSAIQPNVMYQDNYVSRYLTVLLKGMDRAGYTKLYDALGKKEYVSRLTQNVRAFDKLGEFSVTSIILDAVFTDGEDRSSFEKLLSSLDCIRDFGLLSQTGDPDISYIISLNEPYAQNYPELVRILTRSSCVRGLFKEYYGGSTESAYYYGDADRSGSVTAADARMVLRFSVGLDRPASFLIFTLADIDCSGSITAADARACLRISVGLDRADTYYYSAPENDGLISSVAIGLSGSGNTLSLTASTVCKSSVTSCGFSYIKLQRLDGGIWTDVGGACYYDIYRDSNAAAFSVTVSAAAGHTYRAVCEHYAEAPYLKVFRHSASRYDVSYSVTI